MITRHRRSVRLKDHDYSSEGLYFVTICTKDRECLFGKIVNGQVRLNAYGETVLNCWNEIPKHFSHVILDSFVVMPNHIHAILSISNVGAGLPRPSTKGAETAPLRPVTLGKIVAYVKYQSTKFVNEIRNTPGIPVWQRNYYEHIIRNENELLQTQKYILENPLKWSSDPENPDV